MKICSVCHSSYASTQEKCPQCGHQVVRKNGFAAFAPALEDKEEGFKADFYQTYAHLESGHFWFRARGRLITWALAKYAPHMRSLLEIGCGTGYILTQVASAFPKAKLLGSEMFSTGLRFAASRLPSVDFVQMDARDIPFEDEFDAIGAFDVIEHIEMDTVVLQQMYRALKPGGIMLLTVPQHQWLWSQVDEYSCHVRRYAAVELHRKVEDAGFAIVRSTSFVSLLLPAMMISRGAKKTRKGEVNETAELAVPRPINVLFGLLMRLECLFIKVGINFPVGASRLLIARKTIG
ncbi:methyltransferase domain-containing protein [Pandoraea pneumonica]|uniref:class I SAM-dependent methyltransferase n=1 Tax=Pandoraea pneumonica TaxID=2508299 RepID=UPI003CEE11BC